MIDLEYFHKDEGYVCEYCDTTSDVFYMRYYNDGSRYICPRCFAQNISAEDVNVRVVTTTYLECDNCSDGAHHKYCGDCFSNAIDEEASSRDVTCYECGTDVTPYCDSCTEKSCDNCGSYSSESYCQDCISPTPECNVCASSAFSHYCSRHDPEVMRLEKKNDFININMSDDGKTVTDGDVTIVWEV